MSTTNELRTAALYPDLSHTLAAPLLAAAEYPWQVLDELKEFIRTLGPTLPAEEYDCIGEDIWAAKSARIAPTACINGPAIIGPDTEVRHCAFIRGSALVGAGAVAALAVQILAAVAGGTVAYYLIFVVGAWLFALLVYYTVKMM